MFTFITFGTLSRAYIDLIYATEHVRAEGLAPDILTTQLPPSTLVLKVTRCKANLPFFLGFSVSLEFFVS